jgi:hypothetical protein
LGVWNNLNPQEVGDLKSIAKSFLNSVRFGSIFDPDMTEEKVNKTNEISGTKLINHLTGKEALSKQDIEDVKTNAKYMEHL